jgi:hypothetical protein
MKSSNPLLLTKHHVLFCLKTEVNMKEVLVFIDEKKKEFAQLPLFKYLQDKSIDPRQRLAWAPCLTPLAMAFGELNRCNFRKEPTDDPIQKLINQHTYEDDDHWMWFLEDLEKLGFNRLMKFTDSMRFFWGEETYRTRQVCNQIALCTFQAEPIIILVAVKVVEATGNVAFTLTTQLVQELQQITKQNYRYFGHYHLCAENSHTTATSNTEEFLERIQLTPEQTTQAFELVERIFEVFTEAMDEMMAYAENHPVEFQFLQAA